jgi:hypothetical protein
MTFILLSLPAKAGHPRLEVVIPLKNPLWALGGFTGAKTMVWALVGLISLPRHQGTWGNPNIKYLIPKQYQILKL